MSGAEMFRTPVDAYDRFVGRYGAELARSFVEFVGMSPGARVLDVGCGPGALTAVLAEQLGAGAVAAVEPSEPFAAACRSRVPGADVHVAPAESLPFGEADFDFVVSQLVLNFMSDAPAGVREMARATDQGGTVASCVWDYAGEMTLLRAFWDAAREVEPDRAAAADEGVVMRWCTEAELEQLWREGGLQDVRTGPLVVSAAYEDFDDLWSPFPTGVGPAGAFCKTLDGAAQEALRATFRERLKVGSGSFELEARAWAVTGSVPVQLRRPTKRRHRQPPPG